MDRGASRWTRALLSIEDTLILGDLLVTRSAPDVPEDVSIASSRVAKVA
jgi:hypothetical protein